ncbi:hypothetical protein [Mesorhizobium sophorae]|uniref:hypothetical protein n=1 Tax=Mesorhizobium sophorae TaxID=1300294 RepID=UPI00117F8734|nr:hypothetical protein [Mesorhizobium sophorae]
MVLTASHDLGTTLERGKRRIQTASGLARKGRAWVEACDHFGILGVVVGQEVTYSRENGWHYHQHLNVVCDGPTDEEAGRAGGDRDALDELVKARAQEAGEYVADAYKRHIRAHGGKVSDKHGCHVRVAHDADDAADYTSKGSMAWEVSGGHKTETRADGSMTPWDIAEAAAAGDKFFYARWKEYEEAMPGTRSCVVSPRLAKVLEIEAAADAEEGEQVIHESDEIVGQVDAPVWSRWMRHGLAGTFLGRVEERGEIGFGDAVDETQGDADRIEKAHAARDKEKERQRQAGITDRQAGQLKRLAIEAAGRLQEGGGLGSRARLRLVIDGIAAENPALPRLDEGSVIAATTSAASADRENARLMQKIADMLGGTII